MFFSSVVIAMVFALRGLNKVMLSTVQEREFSVNLGNSVYIKHSCDHPQILFLDGQKLLLKVGRANEMVKI